MIEWLEGKMVPNWKDAWRWFSVQAMGIGLVLTAAWNAVPEDLRDGVPSWASSSVLVVLLAAGVIGRLYNQEKPKE